MITYFDILDRMQMYPLCWSVKPDVRIESVDENWSRIIIQYENDIAMWDIRFNDLSFLEKLINEVVDDFPTFWKKFQNSWEFV